MKRLAPLFVVIAGICWGMIGVFSRGLSAGGFSSLQITQCRAFIVAVTMVLGLLLLDRSKLKIHLKDIWMFLGTGILSIVFFNICYFMTVELLTLSMAAIFLYTAPSIVMVLSILLFGEKMNWRKGVSLVLATAGCVFVSGVLGGATVKLTLVGVLAGLGSGIGYALYSIFGHYALQKYHPFTVTAYTFIVAAITLLPWSHPMEMITMVAASPDTMVWRAIMLGLVSTLLPFLCYTKGLEHMDAGTASVIAFIEPMVATMAGIFLFHEKMTWSNLLGIVLIFISVVIVNVNLKPKTGSMREKNMNYRYSYVIFDLDGTLTDSAEGITKCVQYSLADKGVEENDMNKLHRFIGPPLVDSYMEFYGFSEEEAWELTEKYRERYETIGLYENRPYDGILALLQRLHEAGVKIGIATSKPQQCTEDILEHFGMMPYISAVCGARKDGKNSSKQELITNALKLMKGQPEAKNTEANQTGDNQVKCDQSDLYWGAVMVGDRKYDILGAKAVGIDSIGVNYGFAPEGELVECGATYVVDEPEQIGKIILSCKALG